MAVIIEGFYLGGKHTRLVHGPSGAEIATDAPRDNGGEGAAFSPTDLVAAALGSCMMTIMALAGERSGLDLSGMRLRVEKRMQAEPRRIGALSLVIHLPAALDQQERSRLEAAAHACPVSRSLHPGVEVETEFVYG